MTPSDKTVLLRVSHHVTLKSLPPLFSNLTGYSKDLNSGMSLSYNLYFATDALSVPARLNHWKRLASSLERIEYAL